MVYKVKVCESVKGKGHFHGLVTQVGDDIQGQYLDLDPVTWVVIHSGVVV